MPKTIAILYICTGSYRVFWPGFYENFRQNFLPELDKTFFVFTDAAQVAGEDNPDVRRIPQKALPWPYSTLQRFDAFLSQEAALAGYDYLFFANANLFCTGPVHAEEILPDAGRSLTAVCHLPYDGRNPLFHPYERRPASWAGIPYNGGTYYVAGGLNGGTAAAYLALCRELQARTREDLDRGIIARFHDESQLNRLVAEWPRRFRILPPCFCVPEETPLPNGGDRIRVLQKSRFLDVEAVKRAPKPQNFFERKWEAFTLNWLPYLWRARDTLLCRRVTPRAATSGWQTGNYPGGEGDG